MKSAFKMFKGVKIICVINVIYNINLLQDTYTISSIFGRFFIIAKPFD